MSCATSSRASPARLMLSGDARLTMHAARWIWPGSLMRARMVSTNMHNRTFVCFTCRTTERVRLTRLAHKCRICRAPAEHVYHKFRIPQKDDDRAWSELMKKVRGLNRDIKIRAVRQLIAEAERCRHALIAAPENRLIDLRRQLRDAEEALLKWEQWP